MSGKTIRMNRIFGPDGRAVVVAMDHGNTMGALPGLEDPSAVIDRVVAGGADAIMTTLGVATRFGERLWRAGLILRIDGGRSPLGGPDAGLRRLFSVEAAVRAGADAVACMGFPGSSQEAATLTTLAEVAGECQLWQVPLLAEMIPGGFESPDGRNTERVRLAVRIGAELGADIIKTYYTGDPVGFRVVVTACFVPILVLGGPRTARDRDVLQWVHDAIASGARGVAIGRNIWQHPHPQRMVAALAALVHAGASVERAAQELAE